MADTLLRMDGILKKWYNEIRFESSPTAMVKNKPAKELIRLGKKRKGALRILFEKMAFEDKYTFLYLIIAQVIGWFPKLKEDEVGRIYIIRDKFIEKGKDPGYLEEF